MSYNQISVDWVKTVADKVQETLPAVHLTGDSRVVRCKKLFRQSTWQEIPELPTIWDDTTGDHAQEIYSSVVPIAYF